MSNVDWLIFVNSKCMVASGAGAKNKWGAAPLLVGIAQDNVHEIRIYIFKNHKMTRKIEVKYSFYTHFLYILCSAACLFRDYHSMFAREPKTFSIYESKLKISEF